MTHTKKLLLATLLGCSLAASAQRPEYIWTRTRVPLNPVQPIPEGMTWRSVTPQKTERVAGQMLYELEHTPVLVFKFSKKEPRLLVVHKMEGIQVKEVQTISAGGGFLKEISVTYKSGFELRKAAGDSLLQSVNMSDGSEVFKVQVGYNFFEQPAIQNRYYPKPADIPNPPTAMGTFSSDYRQPAPQPFATEQQANDWIRKYFSFVEARIEAMFAEASFTDNNEIVRSLFGTRRLDDVRFANLSQKNRDADYSDFDKCAADFSEALKLMSANAADTAAIGAMGRLLVFYKGFLSGSDPRLAKPQVQCVALYNVAMLNALIGDVKAAREAGMAYARNRYAERGFIIMLADVISNMRWKTDNNRFPTPLLTGL
jgi:hypothetical protein